MTCRLFCAAASPLLLMTEPVHLENVVRKAHQCPFGAHFLQASQQKRRNPRACLICPNTGSTIALRAAYTAFPAFVCSLRFIRSTRVAPFGSGPRQDSLYSPCFCRSVAM